MAPTARAQPPSPTAEPSTRLDEQVAVAQGALDDEFVGGGLLVVQGPDELDEGHVAAG